MTKKQKFTNVLLHIKNNETNEVAYTVSKIFNNEDGSPNPFIWEEGNYSCDCNRELFFCRAKNLPDPNLDELRCTEEKYSVRLIELDTYKTIYAEF